MCNRRQSCFYLEFSTEPICYKKENPVKPEQTEWGLLYMPYSKSDTSLKQLNGEAPLITDPPPTNSTTSKNGRKKKWHRTCVIWQVKSDIWHMTYDMWHVTHGGGWIFSQNFRSLALMIWDVHMICDTWHVTHNILHVTNDICRMTHRGW